MIDTITTSVEETIALGRSFARSLKRGDVVALVGELGSGKTQFVKGVCEGLNVRSTVTSPTFVVLNRYEGRDEIGNELLVHHLDLYRIRSTQELYDLGYVMFSYGAEETTRRIRIEERSGVCP
jgi:tRNA threonylcarbamoyladenosine biosynthesis protein TsaE